ncbi:hypothetical protein KJ966_27830 [bacterium]|nr:hypothetical protein [bacterium]
MSLRVPVSGESLVQSERDTLIKALIENQRNQSKVAKTLGINPVKVLNRIRKYRIDLSTLVGQ